MTAFILHAHDLFLVVCQLLLWLFLEYFGFLVYQRWQLRKIDCVYHVRLLLGMDALLEVLDHSWSHARVVAEMNSSERSASPHRPSKIPKYLLRHACIGEIGVNEMPAFLNEP